MSYRIEQKNGNKVYVYEASNHWDPVKKRAQQKRVYLGVKDPQTGEIRTPAKIAGPPGSRFPAESFMPLNAAHREIIFRIF